MPADCQINACGVMAVGRCGTCGRAFCATHQAYDVIGRPYTAYCTGCKADRARADRERAQVSAQREDEIIRAIQDPYERLLYCLVHCTDADSLGNIREWPKARELCAEILDSSGRWSSTEVARWFVRRAQQMHVPTVAFKVMSHPKAMFGRIKEKWWSQTGWVLRGGGQKQQTRGENQEDAAIFTDGSFNANFVSWQSDPVGRGKNRHMEGYWRAPMPIDGSPVGEFTARALAEMAKLLSI